MTEPKRILVVRPSALGDVCRTVPVLVTLRKAFPGAVIDWVVQQEFVPAIEAHPALDEAVPFPRSEFSGWWRSPRVARRVIRWLGTLRSRHYDLVFDCQGLVRSGLMTWATRAPRRVGYWSAREFGWLGYTVRHPRPAARHTVEQMMALLAAEGLEPVYDMRLYLGNDDRQWWQTRRRELDCPGRYAALAPSSRWASKRWPKASWRALIGPLLDRGFDRVVLIGSPAERDHVEGIVDGEHADRVVDLVGATTLGQGMAVVAESALVIANDSAPLHIAVGFDRPCLGLYGPTEPAEVGPFRRPEAVVRAYTPAPGELVNFKARRLGDSLMRRIRPADVLERVDAALARHPTNPTLDLTPTRRPDAGTPLVGGALS